VGIPRSTSSYTDADILVGRLVAEAAAPKPKAKDKKKV
jgi:hypothetical protein